jgi:DNA polymerase III epsilon subunit-like protein
VGTTTILIIILFAVIIIIWLIVRSNASDDEEDETIKSPSLPDFAKRDPQTGKLSLNISFEPSDTDDGLYLIFDTETTGLPKNKDGKPEDLDNWPRIVQISWIFLDKYYKCVNTETFYVKQDAPIPKEATRIHKIDDKIVQEKGETPNLVFEKLLSDVMRTTFIVAHNIEFDLPIVESEFLRLGIHKPFKGKKKLCTMKTGAGFCKIPRYSGRGYKYPKLEELLEHLYFPGWSNIRIIDAHDAQIDTALTAKCFIKLVDLGYFKLGK